MFFGIKLNNTHTIENIVATSSSLVVCVSNLIKTTNNVLFNRFGTPAFLSSATPFTFNSAYITAAWYDGLQVDVTGSLAGNTLFSITIAPSATAPTLYTFNWAGIDQVTFNSYGGTPNSGYVTASTTQIAIDNFTYSNSVLTPVPFEFDATLGLSVLGGGFLLRKALKKKTEKI